VAGGKAWKTALNTMTMKEQNKLFRKIYKASRKYGVDFEDLKIFFKLARRHGSFWRIDACRVSYRFKSTISRVNVIHRIIFY
jgi:hypothetical protein